MTETPEELNEVDDLVQGHVREAVAARKPMPLAPIDAALRQHNSRPKVPEIDPSRESFTPPPLDLHPDSVRGESRSASKTRTAFEALHSSWSLIADTCRDQRVDNTELAKQSRPAYIKAIGVVERAISELEEHVGVLAKTRDALLTPQVDPHLASEIRSFWRTLRGGNVFGRLMTEASEDIRTCSAVLSGPAYLSGLKIDRTKDVDQPALLRKQAIQHHARVEGAAVQEAEQMLDRLRAARKRCIEVVGGAIHEWNAPASEALQRLTEANRRV